MCAVIVSPPIEIESEFSVTKYFTASMTCYYRGLESYRQNPLAKKHVFLIRRHIVIERVRMKLSNMLPGVVSKSLRDYFLPIFDHCYFVVCNYGQGTL